MKKEQAAEILRLQDQLNVKTDGSNWKFGFTAKSIVIDHKLRVVMAMTELLECFNWNHSKDTDEFYSRFDSASAGTLLAKVKIAALIGYIASWALEDNAEKRFIDMMSSGKSNCVAIGGCEMLDLCKDVIHHATSKKPSLVKSMRSLIELIDCLGFKDELYDSSKLKIKTALAVKEYETNKAEPAPAQPSSAQEEPAQEEEEPGWLNKKLRPSSRVM